LASDELTPSDTDLINEFATLLAHPSLWVEPSPDLEERVVAAIRGESNEARAAAESSGWYRYARPSRVRRWSTLVGAIAVGAAAAVAITLLATRDTTPSPDSTVALAGTDLASGLVGTAELTAVPSGVQIYLRLPGLPRRDGGEFYQVWLRDCSGTQLVPAGSFHDLDDVIAWAGVAPADFPILTVTKEVVAPPTDAAQGSSGEVVAKGASAHCPT